MKRFVEGLIPSLQALHRGLSRAGRRSLRPRSRRPRASFGVYCRDGTNKPTKCKIPAPGFAHLQAMDFIARPPAGDVSAILGSLDIVFESVDGDCAAAHPV